MTIFPGTKLGRYEIRSKIGVGEVYRALRVASLFVELRQVSQPLQRCEELLPTTLTQGFKATPGLELANAFSVLRFMISTP